VLELLRGKATVEQLARRFGVREETIEGWREIALQGLGQALHQGDARTAEERELERRLRGLERAFTDLAIRHELVQREMAKRPSQPGRSSR
jgi:transposase-like protein